MNANDGRSGEAAVIAGMRLSAEIMRGLSSAIPDDRMLSEGLANYAATLDKACDDIHSLSPHAQATIGVLCLWHGHGQEGLRMALSAITDAHKSRKEEWWARMMRESQSSQGGS